MKKPYRHKYRAAQPVAELKPKVLALMLWWMFKYGLPEGWGK